MPKRHHHHHHHHHKDHDRNEPNDPPPPNPPPPVGEGQTPPPVGTEGQPPSGGYEPGDPGPYGYTTDGAPSHYPDGMVEVTPQQSSAASSFLVRDPAEVPPVTGPPVGEDTPPADGTGENPGLLERDEGQLPPSSQIPEMESPVQPKPVDDGEGFMGLEPYKDFVPTFPMTKDPATGEWRNAHSDEIPEPEEPGYGNSNMDGDIQGGGTNSDVQPQGGDSNTPPTVEINFNFLTQTSGDQDAIQKAGG